MKQLQPKQYHDIFIVQFRHPNFDGSVFRRSLGTDKDLAHVVCAELTQIANEPELAISLGRRTRQKCELNKWWLFSRRKECVNSRSRGPQCRATATLVLS